MSFKEEFESLLDEVGCGEQELVNRILQYQKTKFFWSKALEAIGATYLQTKSISTKFAKLQIDHQAKEVFRGEDGNCDAHFRDIVEDDDIVDELWKHINSQDEDPTADIDVDALLLEFFENLRLHKIQEEEEVKLINPKTSDFSQGHFEFSTQYTFPEKDLSSTVSIFDERFDEDFLQYSPQDFVVQLERLGITICPPNSLSRSEDEFLAKQTYNGTDVIVKRLNLPEEEVSSELFSQLVKEAKSYHELVGANHVIKMLGAFASERDAYIVFEYPNGRCLVDHMENRKRNGMSLGEAVKIGLDIAKGVQEICRAHMFHRDITIRNCLVFVDEQGNPIVKIADSGICQMFPSCRDGLYAATESCMVPLEHTAPEVWMEGNFSWRSDIFSLGMTLGEIFSSNRPLSHLGSIETCYGFASAIYKGERVRLPHGLPNRLKSLIESCWDSNKDRRPHVNHVVEELESILNSGAIDLMSLHPTAAELENIEKIEQRRIELRSLSPSFTNSLKARDALNEFGHGPKACPDIAEIGCKLIGDYMRQPFDIEKRAIEMKENKCIDPVLKCMAHFSQPDHANVKVAIAAAEVIQATTMTPNLIRTRVDELVINEECVPPMVSSLRQFTSEGEYHAEAVKDVCAAFAHLCGGHPNIKENRMQVMERERVIPALLESIRFFSQPNHYNGDVIQWASSALLLILQGHTDGYTRRKGIFDDENGVEIIVEALESIGPRGKPHSDAATRVCRVVLVALGGHGTTVERRANRIIDLEGHKKLLEIAQLYSTGPIVNGDAAEEAVGAIAFLMGGGGYERENRCRKLDEENAIEVLVNVLSTFCKGGRNHAAARHWASEALGRLVRGNFERESKMMQLFSVNEEAKKTYDEEQSSGELGLLRALKDKQNSNPGVVRGLGGIDPGLLEALGGDVSKIVEGLGNDPDTLKAIMDALKEEVGNYH